MLSEDMATGQLPRPRYRPKKVDQLRAEAPPFAWQGVGITGMRARLRQPGGELIIQSGTAGTVVRARLLRSGQ